VQGVILAAGHGTRLQPLTPSRSKAMVPVLGRPLVEHVMETLRASGIQRFVFVTGPGDSDLETYLSNNYGDAEQLMFTVQHERKGMAHALGCAAPLIDDTFVLSACDSLTTAANVSALTTTHRETGADVTLNLMEVTPAAVARSAAVVVRNSWVRQIVEKPSPEQAPSSTISLPLYVCSPDLLRLLSEVNRSIRGEYELADALQLLIDRGGRVAQYTTDWRLQVSTPEDLLALNLHLLRELPAQQGDPVSLGEGSRLIPPLVIDGDVEIAGGCCIGPNVYLEGPCRIEADVQLRDTIVLRNATVEQGRHIRLAVVC
jgi:NDP-sugar pyrophosphorylase family protein